MQRENVGLTKIYNWFHDPESECEEIPKLRQLHAEMDRLVLGCYGWSDIEPECQFSLEFNNEESEDEDGSSQKKKYRYRWPDETRDEVLARLLDLNHKRALEEGQTFGSATTSSVPKEKSKAKKSRRNNATRDAVAGLFGTDPREV